MADVVYALHEFLAENEDELSFSAGEAIIVLERDDQYGDGWFQGRNTAGDIGLFPQSYTSVEPPTDSPLSSPIALSPIEVSQSIEPIPVLSGAASDLQHTLDQLKVEAQQTSTAAIISNKKDNDNASIKSRTSQASREGKNSDDEEVPINSNPRAVLAAKAAANAEKEANNEREREKAERERAYDLSREETGLVDGIQLSDESDEEEVVRQELIVPQATQLQPPPIDTNVGIDNRPRVNSSTSAGSIYADDVKSPIRPVTPPSLPSTVPVTSTPSNDVQATPPLPTSARHFALDSLMPSPVIAATAATIGVVGAGIGAVATYLHNDSEPPQSKPEPIVETTPVFVPANVPPPNVLPVNSNSPKTFAVNTPPPTLVSHFLNSQQPQQSYVTSPSGSFGSANQSRSSSRQDVGPFTSNGTSDTSPRGSSYGNGVQTVQQVNGKSPDLPADPTTWGVREVLSWGRMKGFDGLTLAKFEEHEISGDILLEMDVTMLKEIDLAAFGRRVHIYNAIKELKLQAARALSASTSVSPGYSGYEPDSPGLSSSFASPALYAPSPYTMEPESRSTRRGSDILSNMQGLGLDEENNNLSRPASAGSNVLRKSKNASPNHGRAATIDSFNTLEGNSGNIMEEREDIDAPLPVRSGSGMSFRRPSKSALSGGESRKGSMSDSSTTGSITAAKVKKVKSERSFFGAALGRSRKAPPKVPIALVVDTQSNDDRGRGSLSSSRRGTRLFHPFAAGVAVKTAGNPARQSSISSPRDGPSSMTPKTVGVATGEMEIYQADQVLSGNLVDKLGAADYKGWMRKKGENYNTWKQRFFFLKGTHLYYLKSENELKAKGFINLTGYRVLVDPDIHPGEFAFKIVHETEKTHFFSASEQVTIRNWMKSIMKATIGRDYSATVVSSCNVETMSLSAAQSLNPKPRPPSPASRARVQKERYAGANPNTLTPKDAAILMEFATPATPISSKRASGRSSAIIVPSRPISLKPSASASSIQSIPLATPPIGNGSNYPLETIRNPAEVEKEHLISWVNSHTPQNLEVVDLGNSLRSGQVLVRLLENLSNTISGIDDVEFAKFRPAGEDSNFLISDYFDTVFATWDYISPKVSTDNISMDDMLSGNEAQMIMFVQRFRKAYPN